MASSHSFNKLCWAVATIFTFVHSILAAGTPAASTYVRGGGLNNITVALNLPQNNTDNVFFHFNGPTTPSWTAFGFGSQMQGALIFVVYASEDGKNITVSPRLGIGEVEPKHTTDVTVSLFAGSGISNRVFSVNGMCTGCRKWSGGSLDTTSTSADMIYAIGPAGVLNSDELDATLRQHQLHGNFNMDLVQATGVGGIPGTGLSNSSTGSSGSSDDDSGPPGWTVSPGVAAHALVMIVAFLIVFPGGYLFLRIFNKVWLHWSIQSFGSFLVIVGVGGGIGVSKKDNIHSNIDAPHQILGLLIFVLVLATWGLGLVSHILFKRTGSPAKLMLGHRILGPLTVVLGLVNVCVGFNFAGHNQPIIGFVIITLFMIIIVSTIILLKRRRDIRRGAMNTPAAMNFREGQQNGTAGDGAPPKYEAGGGPMIPLQSYQPSGQAQYR